MSIQQIQQYLTKMEPVLPGDPNFSETTEYRYVPGAQSATDNGLFIAVKESDPWFKLDFDGTVDINKLVKEASANQSWVMTDE